MGYDDFDSILATVELLSDPEALASLEESTISSRRGICYTQDEVCDGQRSYSDEEESEKRLIARMGREGYDAARAAIRADLLAHPDANVRERAKDYRITYRIVDELVVVDVVRVAHRSDVCRPWGCFLKTRSCDTRRDFDDGEVRAESRAQRGVGS